MTHNNEEKRDDRKRKSNSKILIVEDDNLNLKIMESFLTELGFINISVAKSGNEALLQLRMKFDLIILDIGLPDLNGIELTIKIRELTNGMNVPIVAITSFDSDVKNMCMAAGMNGYIRKPLSIHTLKNIIDEFICD